MNRIFAIALFAASCLPLAAQEADYLYEFADAQGTIVPSGSVVTITKAEVAEDGSGDIIMDSKLFAKNIDGDADDLLRIAYDVTEFDNGLMTICFPSACASINRAGQGTTQPGKIKGGMHSIATEWYPANYGNCTVKVSLQTVVKTIGNAYEVIDDGPTITLRFAYSDPSSVSASGMSVATPVAYYSLSGQRLTTKPRGVALVRLSDGSVVKRIIR